MARRAKPSPKKIVYLWGAGATQAEAQYLGATISLLMGDNDEFGEGILSVDGYNEIDLSFSVKINWLFSNFAVVVNLLSAQFNPP